MTIDPGSSSIPTNDHDLWMTIAQNVAEFKGTCTRRNVGAVLVVNGRLREIAWNGMERDEELPTCMAGACPRGTLSTEEQLPGIGYSNCVYLHAEYNAAENYRQTQRARNVEGWAFSLGVTIYSSSIPCEDCVKYAAWAGIVMIWNGKEK